MSKKAIVTGGAGFIGSHLIQELIFAHGFNILNIDCLTIGSNVDNLTNVGSSGKYQLLKADIADFNTINEAFEKFQPDVVFHLAAESHVDRSIAGSDAFVHSNIVGTHSLLKAARAFHEAHNEKNFRFIHVSTDEVYGSLEFNSPPFTETTPYAPNSPYSASKAASDHLARAWFETHKLPVIITHCSNNYGPGQFPEKLIPVIILNAISGKDLPVYGNGKNIRDWIFVTDHAKGIISSYLKGVAGEVYNFGGNMEVENITIVNKICHILDEIKPRGDQKSYKEQIRFVTDRKGHDLRYAIDNTKANSQLNWTPQVSFEDGLMNTIKWYLSKY